MGRLISGKRLPEVVSGLVIFRQENASLKARKIYCEDSEVELCTLLFNKKDFAGIV